MVASLLAALALAGNAPPRLSAGLDVGAALVPASKAPIGPVAGLRARLLVTDRVAVAAGAVSSVHFEPETEPLFISWAWVGAEVDADATPVVVSFTGGAAGYRLSRASSSHSYDWGGYLGLRCRWRPSRSLLVGAELRYYAMRGLTAFPAVVTFAGQVGWEGPG